MIQKIKSKHTNENKQKYIRQKRVNKKRNILDMNLYYLFLKIEQKRLSLQLEAL